MPHSPSESNHDRETERKRLATHGQYTVAEIKKLDGLTPTFDAYDLIIRGHTALTVGDQYPADELEVLQISFNGAAAVGDIGQELLRATHIVIPLEGIHVLENVTDRHYDDTRWIENPLNFSMPFREDPVTYPSNPAKTREDFDDDGNGAIPTPSA